MHGIVKNVNPTRFVHRNMEMDARPKKCSWYDYPQMSHYSSPYIEVIQTEEPLDLGKVRNELQTLQDYDTQIYLQGNSSGMDPLEPTRGMNYKKVDANELDYHIPLFDIPYINSIIRKYDLVRTRVMKMQPKRCYSYHTDTTKRLHIPVQTNEHCFMLIEGHAVHLPLGGVYIADTTQRHTALNASEEVRIHIVGAFKQ